MAFKRVHKDFLFFSPLCLSLFAVSAHSSGAESWMHTHMPVVKHSLASAKDMSQTP